MPLIIMFLYFCQVYIVYVAIKNVLFSDHNSNFLSDII